jgi:hypothetical protein
MDTLNHIRDYGMIESDINKFLEVNNLNINGIINLYYKKELINGYYFVFIGGYYNGHYTLIQINNNECYFFDSINNNSYLNDIRMLLKEKLITSYNKQIQKVKKYCGLFCIAFLHYCENNNNDYKKFYDIVYNNRTLLKYIKQNLTIPPQHNFK